MSGTNRSTSDGVLFSLFSDYAETVHVPLVTAICAFGAVTNVTNLVVLTRPALRAVPANLMLMALSSCHLVLIINYLLFLGYDRLLDGPCELSVKSYMWLLAFKLNVNLSLVAIMVQVAITWLLAGLRCASMVSPYRHPFTLKKARYGIALICVTVPLMKISFYFNSEIVPYEHDCSQEDETASVYKLAYTDNEFLFTYNFWFFAVVCKLIPSLFMAVLGPMQIILLIRLQRKRKKQFPAMFSKKKKKKTNRNGIGGSPKEENKGDLLCTMLAVANHATIPTGNASTALTSSFDKETPSSPPVALVRKLPKQTISVDDQLLDTQKSVISKTSAAMETLGSNNTQTANRAQSLTKSVMVNKPHVISPLAKNTDVQTDGPKSTVAAVRERRRGKSSVNTPMMLAVVVCLCVVVELPQGLLNFAYGMRRQLEFPSDQLYSLIGEFFEMLTLLYSTVNFLLYCCMSSQYRRTFKQCILCQQNSVAGGGDAQKTRRRWKRRHGDEGGGQLIDANIEMSCTATGAVTWNQTVGVGSQLSSKTAEKL